MRLSFELEKLAEIDEGGDDAWVGRVLVDALDQAREGSISGAVKREQAIGVGQRPGSRRDHFCTCTFELNGRVR